jgi:ABC-type sugar transport system ATPase subunit
VTLSLRFEQVGKRYEGNVVLRDVTFDCEPGELVVLVGPSGCGKSTLLRMVAGLEEVTEGKIVAGDRVLNDVPPHERGVGMVFQSYALYPHLTVRENLAFPLFVQKRPKAEQDEAVARAAKMLELEPLLDRLPRQLSGGQRQRVAIGRCLVRKPELYCFDEPLSNLDAALRSAIRVEIRGLMRDLGKTALYVTHDQTEAMTMADRIVVLSKGVVQQVGTPEALYTKPANRFVGAFLGSPSMCFARGTVAKKRFESGSLAVSAPSALPEGEVVLGVRAEGVRMAATGDRKPGELSFDAVVEGVEPIGEVGYVHLSVNGARIERGEGGEQAAGAAPHRLLASVPGPRAFRLRPGENVRVSIDPGQAHWFDPESGQALVVDRASAPAPERTSGPAAERASAPGLEAPPAEGEEPAS